MGGDLSVIKIAEGRAHCYKDASETDPVKYLDTTIVDVVEDEGMGEVEEEKNPEEQKEPQEDPYDQKEEPQIDNPKTVDGGILLYVVIFTFSTMLLFVIKTGVKSFSTGNKNH